MKISVLKSALVGYSSDLSTRGNASEADALLDLVKIFRGHSSKSVRDFINHATDALKQGDHTTATQESTSLDEVAPTIARLLALMAALGVPVGRRNDCKALLEFLRKHESASISAISEALRPARRPASRPIMSIKQLKEHLDPSLGDDQLFDLMVAQLKLLDENQFREVAETALELPFDNKKEGLARLKKLHKIARSNRAKERSAGAA